EPDSLEAAPAPPDYVPGPEEPEQVPPSPDYVPGLEYPEYLALADDEIVAEDQPYVDYASHVALSPGYVADSDPEEDSKDGPVDYPADEGDDDDDDDSSNDDEEEEEASKEEEHLAPADSVITPAVDLVPSSEETEPFEMDESSTTPPPPADHTTPLGARISIRPQEPMPFPSEAEVERLLALPTPPSSPLISLSPPSAEERLARCLAAHALPLLPLLIVPHLYGRPNYVRAPRGFKAAMDRLRASSPSTHQLLHPSPPLPPLPSSLHLPPLVPTSLPLPSPPLPASLFIPPLVDRMEDIPKTELPPRKRLCLTALTSGYKVGDSSTTTTRPTGGHRTYYGFISTLDTKTRRQRAEEVGYDIRDVWVDPTEVVEEIAPTTLKGVNARVTELVERVDVLIEDKELHQETVLLMEQEALVSLEAWAQSVGLSSAGQLSPAPRQIQALQARDPTHADDPEGADSCA
ncbi:hypothetical protein Tco_1242406, partial [Tanacetum coccineum]